jgi:hypothetical protein
MRQIEQGRHEVLLIGNSSMDRQGGGTLLFGVRVVSAGSREPTRESDTALLMSSL